MSSSTYYDAASPDSEATLKKTTLSFLFFDANEDEAAWGGQAVFRILWNFIYLFDSVDIANALGSSRTFFSVSIYGEFYRQCHHS